MDKLGWPEAIDARHPSGFGISVPFRWTFTPRPLDATRRFCPLRPVFLGDWEGMKGSTRRRGVSLSKAMPSPSHEIGFLPGSLSCSAGDRRYIPRLICNLRLYINELYPRYAQLCSPPSTLVRPLASIPGRSLSSSDTIRDVFDDLIIYSAAVASYLHAPLCP